ncbi:uncharacterized protein LOC122027548 isoform X1 [Zingiber officinale]|nr:uncharacterized protein LOC122027548 isoform X1 [Zingiber officinale]
MPHCALNSTEVDCYEDFFFFFLFLFFGRRCFSVSVLWKSAGVTWRAKEDRVLLLLTGINMLRQVSSRNHRARGGFRAKTALQISTLVAVCIWLLYQMKYSHDHREAYEEKFNIDEKQSELTSFGRKDLEEVEQGEIKEKVSQTEHSEQKLQIAQKVDRDRKKRSLPNEHEEHSHEAREKSFKGDDASSEVVHNTEEVEHEERTREARERSFKADDASSAVGHVPLNDSESEIGGFVSVEESNSSLVHEFNQTLPETLEKRNASSGGEPSDLETDHIRNETGVLKFHANESESQVELGLRSRDLSNNQRNVQKITTVPSKNSTQAQSNETTEVDPTIVARDLQNQTSVPPLQASIDSANSEFPTSEKKSDGENSKTSSPESKRERHHLPKSLDIESIKQGYKEGAAK